MIPVPAEFLRAVQADVGRSAALQAWQFIAAALTGARVHEMSRVSGAGMMAARGLVSDQDRQVARFTAHALAGYPELVLSMWAHLDLLDCPFHHEATRDLLLDAAEIFADSTLAEAA